MTPVWRVIRHLLSFRSYRRHAMALIVEKTAVLCQFVCMASWIFHNLCGTPTMSLPHYADSNENNTRKPINWWVGCTLYPAFAVMLHLSMFVCFPVHTLKSSEHLWILSNVVLCPIPPIGELSYVDDIYRKTDLSQMLTSRFSNSVDSLWNLPTAMLDFAVTFHWAHRVNSYKM